MKRTYYVVYQYQGSFRPIGDHMPGQKRFSAEAGITAVQVEIDIALDSPGGWSELVQYLEQNTVHQNILILNWKKLEAA